MEERERMVVDDAVEVAHRVVWSVVTTVDAAGRPRSRVMHPVWVAAADGVTGWVLTRRSPVKVGHLATNPHVTCAYVAPNHDVATFDCTASWAGVAGVRAAWDAFVAAPAPVGYDPAMIFAAGLDDPEVAALALAPYRVQVEHADAMARGERPRVALVPPRSP